MYLKILSEDECHNGLQYQTGLNVDPVPFNPTGSCRPGGIYFSNEEYILDFIDYGPNIREVKLPDDAKIYKDPDGNKWKADKIILGKSRSLAKVSTWKWLIKQGSNVLCCIDQIAANGHLDAVKYLCKF